MIMLGPRVHPSHSCSPGVLRWRFWSRSNRLLERSFWRRCWTRVSPPVRRRARLRPEWFAHRTTSPDRHLGVKDGRADRRHPGRPKSPLNSTGSTPCIARSSPGSRSKTGGSRRLRASYQGLLKRGGDRADLEEAIRTRLARVTQHEQAARSARAIESILARSHRRDREVIAVRQRLAQQARSRARAYDAVGFVQPSARKVDGHKVFTLIGRDGTAIAYLDIPPGLNPEPLARPPRRRPRPGPLERRPGHPPDYRSRHGESSSPRGRPDSRRTRLFQAGSLSIVAMDIMKS